MHDQCHGNCGTSVPADRIFCDECLARDEHRLASVPDLVRHELRDPTIRCALHSEPTSCPYCAEHPVVAA